MAPLASLAVLVLALQSAASPPPPPRATLPTSVPTATAIRAATPPVIDGRDIDEVWRLAPVISAFRQFRPVEDAEPSFRTETKVAYDARNFYVFIRAFDPHPDSILKLLARRDIRTASDQLKIIVDSYHDRRTGYEFAVNPAGVKRDYAVYDDGNEDDAWDGVWEAGTQVDSLGWTAEFRIPLSQMRYTPGPTNTFGFAVWRDIDRYTERVSWPLYRVSRPGLMSQLGEVVGLDGLATPRRIEVTPYVVTKNLPPDGPGLDRAQKLDAGADIKYGLTSNITVDATVNPDFGQVEADPSVLNLSAYETFFQERRPFFIEGTGIFQFGVNCSVVNCSGEGLFYSRRVGHASRILGAAKVTGRLPSGLTLGLRDAVTNNATNPLGQTLEPTTNYAAFRAQQDFRKGESGIGIMATAVNRRRRSVDRERPAEERLRGRLQLPPSLRGRALPAHRVDRCQPRRRHRRRDRRDATQFRTLLSAARRQSDIRLNAHQSVRGRRGAPVPTDERLHPVRDELPAAVPRLRGERLWLPAPSRRAELEHLGVPQLDPAAPVLSNGLLELQLVAVLDDGGSRDRARGQHERPLPAQQPVVGTRRRDARPAGHGLLRPLRAGRAGGARRSVPVGLGRHGGRRAISAGCSTRSRRTVFS